MYSKLESMVTYCVVCSGKMPDLEYIILSRWFDYLVETEDCQLDLIGECGVQVSDLPCMALWCQSNMCQSLDYKEQITTMASLWQI